ncbi:NUDIX domain-containing protein [Candidatus Bathyarchaeota archaeon]|nr:NUDIX domain-containing protein [Candidatus Bathyarchaeota archaeon]
MTVIEFIARAVIRRDDEVLLAHRIGETNTFLPGGHVEPGEYARDALRRELFEELGVDSVIGDFVGVIEHKFTDRKGRRYEEVNLIFEASIETRDVTSAEGHLEFIWAKPGEFKVRNLLPGSLPGLLAEWFETGKPFHE